MNSQNNNQMYHFYISLQDDSIVEALDVNDALERGMPDYYGIAYAPDEALDGSSGTITGVGKTVLTALSADVSFVKAGSDIQTIIKHFTYIPTEFYEESIKIYLLPITKELYKHAYYTSFAPYKRREDGRCELDNKRYLHWLMNYNKTSLGENKFSHEFSSILPLIFMAWHSNLSDIDWIISECKMDFFRKSNGDLSIR